MPCQGPGFTDQSGQLSKGWLPLSQDSDRIHSIVNRKGTEMVKALIFVVGLLVGAYYNTAVVSIANACFTAAGQAMAAIGRQILQFGA